MRKLITAVGCVLLIFSLTGPVMAHNEVYNDYPESDVVLEITDDIALSITGEARTRYETHENFNDFDSDYDDEFGFVPTRFNLGFRLDLPREVAAYIEVQNLSVFGGSSEERFYESASPIPGLALYSGGMEVEEDDIGLYQGYIEMAHIADTIFSVRFGRQEFAYGSEFLLGNLDFYGGLSLDGIKGIFEFSEDMTLDLFWAKVSEENIRQASGHDLDADLLGGYATWNGLYDSKVGLDVYALAYRSGMNDEVDNADLHSYWIGGRFFRNVEHGFHFSAEGTYQFGDINDPDVTGQELDIDAFAFELMGGWTWDVKSNPDLHAGYTIAGGDDDPEDGDYDMFFQAFPDFHPRAGAADFITAISNIEIIQLGYTGSYENQSWGIELYNFDWDESPIHGGDESLGNEYDIWYAYEYTKHLSVEATYGLFDPGDGYEDYMEYYMERELPMDDAWRFYVNLLLRF